MLGVTDAEKVVEVEIDAIIDGELASDDEIDADTEFETVTDLSTETEVFLSRKLIR